MSEIIPLIRSHEAVRIMCVSKMSSESSHIGR